VSIKYRLEETTFKGLNVKSIKEQKNKRTKEQKNKREKHKTVQGFKRGNHYDGKR